MKYAVGLMSGTSLDGIDAALVKIEGCGTATKVELIEFITAEYTDTIVKEIKECSSIEKSDVRKICSLNFKLGNLFADAVKKVCKKGNINLEDLAFIGSHGQTIWHNPNSGDHFARSTLQIGEPAVIAYQTKTKVVSDFRVMDMAAGGEGAPLVPFVDYILFSNLKKNIILQNIGGIGNLTFILKDTKLDDVIAFDTGPGNMVINELCKQLFNIDYDKDGHIANKGSVNEQMLEDLMSHHFITKTPPKSTGREEFGESYTRKILEKYGHLKSEDLIATATMFTAKSIVKNYTKYILNKHELDLVVISGGGSYNNTLVNMIRQQLLHLNIQVVIQEDLSYSSEAKEAIAFAILANETLHGNPSNLIKVTGAKKYVVLGNITPWS